MYETQRNAGRLFLHEHPWDAWSRGLSFVNEMAEKDGVHKTKGDLWRFQLATNSVEKGSWFMSNSECIIEELSKRCHNKSGQAKNLMKNFVVAVLKGVNREIGSVEEPNVLELDEYAEELQNVFDSISGVRLDPELLGASRKGRDRLHESVGGVYRKRPRSWAKDKGIHVIPTKWVDVNKGDDKRPECRSRLCGKELKRWDPTMPGTCASMGPFECVMFFSFQSADVETRGKWCGDSEDLVLGCFEGTLSSWSDQ